MRHIEQTAETVVFQACRDPQLDQLWFVWSIEASERLQLSMHDSQRHL